MRLGIETVKLRTRKKMKCQIEHLECQTDYIGVLTMG